MKIEDRGDEGVTLLHDGYIKVVETWGNDRMVIEAARMSTQAGFRGWGTEEKPGDERLLGYLWRNKHHTPFEMAGMTVEVRAPIMVFREWHRHRTQSYNEASARYAPLPALDYVPSRERLLRAAGSSKQSQSTGAALARQDADEFRRRLEAYQSAGEDLYQWALKAGVPKELARLSMTVGRFSTMRASANLRNWLAFVTLRADEAAQWEIREYAEVVASFLRVLYPRTMELYDEGRRGS